MKIFRFASATVAFLIALVSAPLAAQQVDIIRGRVMGPDTLPVPNVIVTATTLSGNVSRTVRTDKNGRYTISFPGAEGDYWVTFASVGFSMRRYEVKRTADQEILIADARLSPSAVTLESFQVVERAAVSRSDTVSDVSGNEKAIGSDPGFLTADQLGDLAAMAAAIPGVQLLPGADGAADAFSVFGLGGDQNNTQLNGLSFGDASVPRDASVSTSLSTSPYDVARGGFSGGQLQVRTQSGSNFMRRSFSSNLNTPKLQFLDPAGIATGQQYTALSFGAAASGPLKPDQAFYNTSFQFDHRANDLQTLLNSSALGFQTVGIAPDSVARLLQILGKQNSPVNVSGFPTDRATDRGSFLGSFDFVQPNSSRGNSFTLTLTGNLTHNSPTGSNFGGSSLSTPSRAGTSTNYSAGGQVRHSGLLGIGGVFTETNVGYSIGSNKSTPYYNLPSGSVRVNSLLADGSQSVSSLAFGGSPFLSNSSNNTVSGVNTLSWFSPDNHHRVKFTSELRRDEYSQDLSQNQFGSFSYNSLADLDAGVPASFTRQLTPRVRNGSQLVGAFSLGDAWRPTSNVQVQYGLRYDANKYLAGPASNPAVSANFKQNNTDVPSRGYFSPRVGFSWTYGTADQVTLLPGMVRAPRAVVRGGFGVFQNTPGVQLVGNAIDNTGLPSGVQQLTCLGTAAPIANWSNYIVNQASIPTTCADGSSGTVFSNSTPNVVLFDPNYMAQRSLRSNVQWSGPILKNRLQATIDATWSRNQHQSGSVDLNFTGIQRFTLPNENGRQVFVSPTAIVTTTGQVAFRDARLFPAFGRVTQNRSDISSETKQLTVGIRPLTFNSQLSWGLSYVLQDAREQFLGFNSTVSDPRSIEWSRGSFGRHQIQYSFGYNFFNTVRVSWNGNIRSGSAYTPVIAGDVNGDSYSNDRAYIFDPSKTADPLVAAGMQNLLTTGTKQAQECLRAQLGTLAARNSCTGPWLFSGNLNVSFNSLNVGLPQRATLSLQISNPLTLVDRAINGSTLRGWGQNIQPPQQLLFVRGFDAVTSAYKYEVNQRFGSTRPSQSSNRSPAIITALIRFDIGPTRERQQLLQQLDRGRTRPGNKPTIQALRGSGNIGLINPMQQIMQQADTLKLTRRQADSLAVLNRLYILKSDSIWAPVAKLLAELPDRYNRDLAYDRYTDAREQSVDMLMKIVPNIKKLLTAEQFRILPTTVAGFLDKRTLKGIRSGTAGGGGGGMGGGGGGGGGGGRRGG